MFENIGGKIKKLAVTITVLGMIASIVLGIISLVNGAKVARYYNNENPLLWTGLITIVAGCLGSWLGSFFIYGFGELIERAVSIDRKMNSQQ